MTNSEALYVYLQRPDTSEWVTVGRYTWEKSGGVFQYAPLYLAAALPWALDPLGLPLGPQTVISHTYGGLHSVLRDACPDDWGKTLLRREHNLPETTSDWKYLALASNSDRWGALAFGKSKTPSVAALAHPRLHDIDELVIELVALAERRPAVNARLRQRLLQTPSLGGARPKATIRDKSDYWVVKPWTNTDIEDIPMLEHASHCWGRAAGLNLAETILHSVNEGQSVVRVRRFDRVGERRAMVLSGATLLQVEYPAHTLAKLLPGQLSYANLAYQLKLLGAPIEDRQELFYRMIFNFLVGNDDDHPRNHAVVYVADEQRWRLSPGFDVVPNPVETPTKLVLAPTVHSSIYARDVLVSEYHRFGFDSLEQADGCLTHFLARVHTAFEHVGLPLYPPRWRPVIQARLREQLVSLGHRQ